MLGDSFAAGVFKILQSNAEFNVPQEWELVAQNGTIFSDWDWDLPLNATQRRWCLNWETGVSYTNKATNQKTETSFNEPFKGSFTRTRLTAFTVLLLASTHPLTATQKHPKQQNNVEKNKRGKSLLHTRPPAWKTWPREITLVWLYKVFIVIVTRKRKEIRGCDIQWCDKVFAHFLISFFFFLHVCHT